MQKYLKHISVNKLIVISSVCGFLFAYLSSISVFNYDGALISGSTSIASSPLGSRVAKNAITSSSTNILEATSAKVTVTIKGSIHYFNDLQTAINSIPDDSIYTITLMRNIEITNEIKIPGNRNIVIDGRNQYSLIRGQKDYNNWYTGRIIYIDKTSSLTLRNMTIDLNNNWTFDEKGYNNALNKQEVTKVNAFINSEMNSRGANNWVIYNRGNLKLENMLVKNHFSPSFGIIYSSENSKVTIANTEITHCAVLEGGLVGHLSGKRARIYIEEGTSIHDNFAGGNGGIFKIQSGAIVTMNDGEIISNKTINSDGFVALIQGDDSSFILNNGVIGANTGLIGENNQYNGAIYIQTGGYFEMNGGVIENNTGNKRGVIDVSKTNADIKLNAGVIQNNNTYLGYENYTAMYLGEDYNLVIGKKMTISDNLYVTNRLVNNGIINGDVIINVGENRKNLLSGSGKINGNVIVPYIAYNGDDYPNISYKMVKGKIILHNEINRVLLTFEYNGGVDEDGFSRNIISTCDYCEIEVPNPTKPGYHLAWYTDKELTSLWEETAILEDTTLYAGWKINNYTVTWDINGSIVTRNFNYNEIIQMPEDPVKTGYEFVGWIGYQDGMRMPDNDVVFTAKWKEVK